jgi:hypothetical protein
MTRWQIVIFPNIHIDNRGYIPTEAMIWNIAGIVFSYQLVVRSQPIFFKLAFPPVKLLNWEKKNQPPPPKVIPVRMSEFSYCSEDKKLQ